MTGHIPALLVTCPRTQYGFWFLLAHGLHQDSHDQVFRCTVGPRPTGQVAVCKSCMVRLLCCCRHQSWQVPQHNVENCIVVSIWTKTFLNCLVTTARPSVSSSLQITNRSFRYASPYLWNQLPSSFRQPHSVHFPPGSPHPVHIISSQSPPLLSHLSLPRPFIPDLKLKSFPPQLLLFLPDCLHRSGTCTELSGHWRLFVLVSFFSYNFYFLSTCARLSWSLFFLSYSPVFICVNEQSTRPSPLSFGYYK